MLDIDCWMVTNANKLIWFSILIRVYVHSLTSERLATDRNHLAFTLNLAALSCRCTRLKFGEVASAQVLERTGEEPGEASRNFHLDEFLGAPFGFGLQ